MGLLFRSREPVAEVKDEEQNFVALSHSSFCSAGKKGGWQQGFERFESPPVWY